MGYKLLVETSDPAEIALIKSVLDSEGILYFAHGEAFQAVRLPVVSVRFLVAEDRFAEAEALIRNLYLSREPSASGPEDSDGDV